MHQEVKFRGKKILGSWAYGYYNESRIPVKYADENVITKSRILSGNENNFIIPETTGQFINAYDKHNEEIYSGDILKHETEGLFTIVWDNDFVGFAAKTEGSSAIDSIYKDYFRKCEIIGNIHDNPELLKSDGEK